MTTRADVIDSGTSACADDCCSAKSTEIEQLASRPGLRRVLVTVLAINATMFVVELTAGILSGSSALMADSVDMFGDASVYVLSLYALDRGLRWRAGAALAKGGIIFVFGMGILVQVAWRSYQGGIPASEAMGIVGFIALAANLTCFLLLWRFRTDDINMSSTFECSRNDVIANVGVLVAAVAVWRVGAAWPDLLVGVAIAAVFLRSAWSVTRSAWPEFHTPGQTRTLIDISDSA